MTCRGPGYVSLRLAVLTNGKIQLRESQEQFSIKSHTGSGALCHVGELPSAQLLRGFSVILAAVVTFSSKFQHMFQKAHVTPPRSVAYPHPHVCVPAHLSSEIPQHNLVVPETFCGELAWKARRFLQRSPFTLCAHYMACCHMLQGHGGPQR